MLSMGSRSTLWCSLSIFLLFASFEVYLCIASDTMAPGQSLSGKETLVSAGEVFELGFFTPGNNSQNHYIGIWPKIGPVEKKRVVWVANRDNPVKEPSSSELKLVEDGNLVLFNEFKILVWSTNISSNTMNSSILVLGDDGNLILRDRLEPSDVIWQSFDYPTDTLLAGQKMGMNRVTGLRNVFTSWKTLDDPSPGNSSVQIHESRAQYMIWYLSRPYWISGEWNGQNFSSKYEMTTTNFRYFSDEKERYFTFGNHSMSRSTMFVIDPAGPIQQWQWSENDQSWLSVWVQPRGPCHVYDFCGAFSNCAQNDTRTCECLPGFELSRDWASDSYTCVRRIQLQCGNSTYKGESDKFFKIPQTVLSIDQNSSSLGSVQACESACLSSCSCTAYAYDGGRCTTWDGDLLNVQPPQLANFGVVEFFLRVAASEESLDGNRTLSNERNGTIISDSVNRNNRQIWLTVALPIALTLLTLSFIACWLWKRKLKQKGRKDRSQDLLLFDTGVSLETVNDGRRNMTNQEQARKKDADLPIFSFSSVSAATNHFSLANKLGEGGFGPVYKGKLLNGQVVAVKRLSRSSGQGLEELKNETQLIAKLQHRNLVQLLGCCIEGEEKILVYEYMSNNSLDSFIFDANKKGKLDWGNRVHIIKGIAQGLLYLHQYSRVRIIHRDLKLSNILLDSDMNPKISDFGMARIFGGDDSQANTKRIVGTFGYMPPEYAFKGIFSVKSDVFSFGVLVLEILSGKRNTGFDLSDSWNLLEHAWKLWNEERCLELMDPILGEPSFAPTPVRHIHVALLCVQESAADRPTTSDVVAMLNNESVIAPSPKLPAFFAERAVLDESSDTKKLVFTVNEMTHSLIEAR